MKKLSVVTAYYNRKELFIRTLKTINNSKYAKDIEVIVVDDGSREEERLEDLLGTFNFDFKVIRLNPEDKWYYNPSVPFNVGIKAATGKLTMLQNPECLHVGDLVSTAIENIKDSDYFSFGCYSLTEDVTERFGTINFNSDKWLEKINLCLTPIKQGPVECDGCDGWYNHSRFRPVAYHFCSVIPTKHIQEMGGFDERYAKGIAFDDNEILLRIRRKGLTINVIDSPFVVHQHHYSEFNWAGVNNTQELLDKNKKLFNEVTLKETGWKIVN